jgi:hypothetical protein
VAVPAVLLTLALVAAAMFLLRRSTRRAEAAAEVVAGLDTAAWSTATAELQAASGTLRDAVDQRLSR